MAYINDQILKALRDARARKGLSQRELSARSGVPQSHISKIEAGGVDLRMSSLIALARALDMELFVAPKQSMPAIKSIVRSSLGEYTIGEVAPAYSLDALEDQESIND